SPFTITYNHFSVAPYKRPLFQYVCSKKFVSINSSFEKCSAVHVADQDRQFATVSFTCFNWDFLISRDNLLIRRLFSGSVVRRAATQPPLTTFTEDEEVMRESGMTAV